MAGMTPIASSLAPIISKPVQNFSLGNFIGGVAKAAASSYIDTLAGSLNAGQYQQRRQNDEALRQLQQRQVLEQKQSREKAALERQKLALDTAEAEEKRREALKRAVARSNASFAGRGLSSSTGGSADAILLGLFEESEEARLQRENLDRLRTIALDQELTRQQQRNLLELNQQRRQYELQNSLF